MLPVLFMCDEAFDHRLPAQFRAVLAQLADHFLNERIGSVFEGVDSLFHEV